ncbi:hypothetical protein CEUSTIGMA_g11348.t1 [Chlamydomonas eustigma]|uniref:EF-hand domain-containing protein n=1 Tax=Chlamydomonas eustigma TaxID=1157962 RepID=A0A250XLH6_9CHLO|nr:hypothetical protein CEUSTIGMA_g11348.t1 [Chlamydomonas eustigma]|eukprot:GAX83924.1 hypothetical protein CEUSTIGMA_g11348.t1 [Chlamydomonas eustigma]
MAFGLGADLGETSASSSSLSAAQNSNATRPLHNPERHGKEDPDKFGLLGDHVDSASDEHSSPFSFGFGDRRNNSAKSSNNAGNAARGGLGLDAELLDNSRSPPDTPRADKKSAGSTNSFNKSANDLSPRSAVHDVGSKAAHAAQGGGSGFGLVFAEEDGESHNKSEQGSAGGSAGGRALLTRNGSFGEGNHSISQLNNNESPLSANKAQTRHASPATQQASTRVQGREEESFGLDADAGLQSGGGRERSDNDKDYLKGKSVKGLVGGGGFGLFPDQDRQVMALDHQDSPQHYDRRSSDYQHGQDGSRSRRSSDYQHGQDGPRSRHHENNNSLLYTGKDGAEERQQQQTHADYARTGVSAASLLDSLRLRGDYPVAGSRHHKQCNAGGSNRHGMDAAAGHNHHQSARAGGGGDDGTSIMHPRPACLQEIQVDGKPFLLDIARRQLFKEVRGAAAAAPEHVGKWVQNRVVFLTPITERDFYSALAVYLQRKSLTLEDLFAVLDADLDGALEADSEMLGFIMEVMPNLAATDALYFLALMDFDDDGRVYLEDVEFAEEECYEAAGEMAAGPSSKMVHCLQRVAAALHKNKALTQDIFSSLDSTSAGWLEPAQWVTFFRILDPNLTSREIRYILSHVYEHPADNRKSLKEVSKALDMADHSYTEAARRGLGPGAAAGAAAGMHPVYRKQGDRKGLQHGNSPIKENQQGSGAEGHTHHHRLPRNHQHHNQKDAIANISRAAPSGTAASNPRSAVAHFFAALQTLMHTQKVSLKELLRRVDSNCNGKLDAPDLRKFVRMVMPTASEAQSVYIRGALNPGGLMQVPMEELLRRCNKEIAMLAAAARAGPGAAGGGAAASPDALLMLAEYLMHARVSLETLVKRFTVQGASVLTTSDLIRMLKYVRPDLSDKRLEKCLSQLRARSDLERDDAITVHELRTALQAKQAEIAALRARQAQQEQPIAATVGALDTPYQGTAALQDDHSAARSWDEHQNADALKYLPDVQLADRADLIMQAPHNVHLGSLLEVAGGPLRTGNHRDPFTLAFYKQEGLMIGQAGNSAPSPARHTMPPVDAASLTVDTILQLQSVKLEPLVYIGHQFVLDPLSNLVYLPTSKPRKVQESGAGAQTAWNNSSTLPGNVKHEPDLERLLKKSDLRLFGRLRPDRHVQRVESPSANRLFERLDVRLRSQRCTLSALTAPYCRASPPPPGVLMDFSGLSRLLLDLEPACAPSDLLYFYVLFDLDGDGFVHADDIMDAFEEAGTTLSILQTPANQVHAKAFKLLTKLAGTILDDEVLMYRLYLEYDRNRSGSLSLADLCKFLCHVSHIHSLQQYHALQNRHPLQQVLPYKVSADEIGAVAVYLQCQAAAGKLTGVQGTAASSGTEKRDNASVELFKGDTDAAGSSAIRSGARTGAHGVQGWSGRIEWSAFLAVISSMDINLPTEHRDGSPVRGRPPGPTSAGTAALSLLMKQQDEDAALRGRRDFGRVLHDSRIMPRDYPRRGSTIYSVGIGSKITDEYGDKQPPDHHQSFGLKSELLEEQQHGHPVRSTGMDRGAQAAAVVLHPGQQGERFGMAAEVAGTAGLEKHPAHHVSSSPHSSMMNLRQDSAAALLLELRPEPLRPKPGSGSGGHHSHRHSSSPHRQHVDLTLFTLPSNPNTPYLLDSASQLLYFAPPSIWKGTRSTPAAHILGEYHQGALSNFGLSKELDSFQQQGPHQGLTLPYPALAGRLQGSDGQVHLLPAHSADHVHRVFAALASLAADEYCLSTTFKLKDRDGRGLDQGTFHVMLSDMSSGGLMGMPETSLLMAVMDTNEDGRVTIHDVLQACAPLAPSAMTGSSNHGSTHPWLRGEQVVLTALNAAATLLEAGRKRYWAEVQSLVSKGPLTLPVISELLREVLPGLTHLEIRITAAYLSIQMLDRNLTVVSPDELLQILHAIPMRVHLPAEGEDAVDAAAAAAGPGRGDRRGMLGRYEESGEGYSSILTPHHSPHQQIITFKPGFERKALMGDEGRSGSREALLVPSSRVTALGTTPGPAAGPGSNNHLLLPLIQAPQPHESLRMMPLLGVTAPTQPAGFSSTSQLRLQPTVLPPQLAPNPYPIAQQLSGRILQSAVSVLPPDSFLPPPPDPLLHYLGGSQATMPRLTPQQQQQQPWVPDSSGVGTPLLGQLATQAQQQRQQGLIAAAAAASVTAGALYIDDSSQQQQQSSHWTPQNRGYVPPPGGYHQPLAPWVPAGQQQQQAWSHGGAAPTILAQQQPPQLQLGTNPPSTTAVQHLGSAENMLPPQGTIPYQQHQQQQQQYINQSLRSAIPGAAPAAWQYSVTASPGLLPGAYDQHMSSQHQNQQQQPASLQIAQQQQQPALQQVSQQQQAQQQVQMYQNQSHIQQQDNGPYTQQVLQQPTLLRNPPPQVQMNDQLQHQLLVTSRQQSYPHLYPSIPPPYQYNLVQKTQTNSNPASATQPASSLTYPSIPSRQYQSVLLQLAPHIMPASNSQPQPVSYVPPKQSPHDDALSLRATQQQALPLGARMEESPYQHDQQSNSRQGHAIDGTSGSTTLMLNSRPQPWHQGIERSDFDPPYGAPPPGSRSSLGSEWLGGGDPAPKPHWPRPLPETALVPVQPEELLALRQQQQWTRSGMPADHSLVIGEQLYKQDLREKGDDEARYQLGRKDQQDYLSVPAYRQQQQSINSRPSSSLLALLAPDEGKGFSGLREDTRLRESSHHNAPLLGRDEASFAGKQADSWPTTHNGIVGGDDMEKYGLAAAGGSSAAERENNRFHEDRQTYGVMDREEEKYGLAGAAGSKGTYRLEEGRKLGGLGREDERYGIAGSTNKPHYSQQQEALLLSSRGGSRSTRAAGNGMGYGLAGADL